MQALLELAPLAVFLVAYYVRGLYFATGALMVAMGLLLLVDLARERRIPPMHGLSAALVFAFGGATLALHDQRYIQWKPTIFFWLVSAAFLLSLWIGERPLVERLLSKSLGSTLQVPGAVWRRLTWVWVSYCAALGVLNLVVAFNASQRAWVNFKVFGLTLAMFLFIALQVAWLARRAAAVTSDSSAAT
ncbi:MAG TPA: inner membrane-spanning protein YciB [Steroidobacteraceae bacterium]|nr:inner membrane-spanning protein YciB [Steroidobacteraceae bacterium]